MRFAALLLLLLLRISQGQKPSFAKRIRERRKRLLEFEREQIELSQRNETKEEKQIREEREHRASSYRLPRLERPVPAIQFGKGEFRASARQLLVSPEHKLVFCAIPKVACTEFMRLMHRLRGDAHWRASPHFRKDTLTLADYDIEEATEIMNDPQWTKAVFFRDPLKRLLSAYLDKFIAGPRRGIHPDYGVKFFQTKGLNFSHFVQLVAANNTKRKDPRGLHLGTNQHWKPQRYMCSLEKFAPVFHFIGRYENLQEHTESLLRTLDLWQDYGKSGWAPTSIRATPFSRKKRKIPVRHAPSTTHDHNSTKKLRDSLFARNVASHRTGSDFRYRQHFSPQVEALARKAYALDYEFFEILSVSNPHHAPTSGAAWARFIHDRLDRRRLCALGGDSAQYHFGSFCSAVSFMK